MNKTKQFFLFLFISFILIGSFLIFQNSRVLAQVTCNVYRSASTCEAVSGCDWVNNACVSSGGGDGVISCSSSNCSACVNQTDCQATNYCVWNVTSCQAPAPVSPISSWCKSAHCGGCNQTECTTATWGETSWPLNALCQWENNFCGSQLMDFTKSSFQWWGSQSEKKIYSADGTKMYGVSESYHIGDGGGHTPYLDINVLGPYERQCTSIDLMELDPEACPSPDLVETKNQNGLANLFSIAKAAPPGQCWGRGTYCSIKYPWFIKRAELYTLATDKPDNYGRCRMRINAVDRNGDWINQGLLSPTPTSSPVPTEEGDGRKGGVFNENNQNFSFHDLFKNLVANFKDLIPKSLAQISYNSIYGSLSSYQVCGYQTGYWAQARAMPVNETLHSAGARLEATVNGNWEDIVRWDGQVRYWGERMLMKPFTVDKPIIHPKEAVTLNWEVLNAALSKENYPEVHVFIGDAQCAAPYNCQPNSKFFVGKEIGEKGSLTVYPNQTTNFYLIAKGASGEGLVYFISEPVYVYVLEEAVDLKVKKTTDTDYTDGPITVDEGSNIQLQWKGRDVTTCTASATPVNTAWQGQVATTSSVTINNITANTIFSIDCQSNEGGGSASDSVRVNISGTPTCNIDVKATCDSSPYSGNASYYLNGPSTFEGNYAPYPFKDIPSGLYYLAYVYGGPGLFSGVSPFNPQYCFSGQALELTMNFTNCGEVSPTPPPGPGNNPPEADILCWATKDSEACLGLIDSDPQTPSVILYSHSSDPDNDITSCSWQVFNNNNQLIREQANCSPLIWDDELGIYRATLRVTDSRGNSDTAQKNFQIVSVNELTCDFAWDPDSPNAKQPVDFFDRSLTPAGTTLKSWFWTFEEGNPATSTLQSPQDVLFDSADEKDVTLKATNSLDKTCTLIKPVKVKTISPKWKEVIPQ